MNDAKKTGRFIGRFDCPRRGRGGLRRFVPSWRQLLSLCTLGIGALSGLFAVVYANVDIPDENAESRQQASVYYWADGSQMVSVGAVNRQNVPLAQVPQSVRNAVIAAENESFYSDSGVSLKGIARAAVNMVTGGDAQGGSTITQQYVKNTYLSQEQTLKRKVKEFFIALKLDNRKSKDEILQGYLNTSWFGRGSFGIQAAANAYYGIPARELNPSQAAVLAATLKGAEQYDPAGGGKNHQRAVERWEWILDRQVEVGLMTRQERDRYREFPEPRKPAKPTSQAGQTGYLVDVANKYIKSRTGLTDRDLARGGYRIHTTFDKARVAQLEKAVTQVRKRDIDPKKRKPTDTYVEFGAASVRPSDGAVVALYGGANAIEHFSNNADTSGVPAASAFKPFVMAAALQDQGPRAAYPAPGRPDEGPEAGSELSEGLVTSAHAPFVAAGKRIGLDKVKETAVAAGLREESMAPLEPMFALGSSTPSAIRLAGAYTLFPNGGTRAEPYSVTRVLRDGRPVDGFVKPRVRRVLERAVARGIERSLRAFAWKTLPPRAVDTLQDVSAGGTGAHDRMRSAWFIGNDGRLTTAVTLFRSKPGAPQLLPLQGVGGPDTERGNALPPRVWAAYTAAAA